MRTKLAVVMGLLLTAALALPMTAGAAAPVVVLSAEGGRLTAYETAKYKKQTVLKGTPFKARGEICADPRSPRRFVVGAAPSGHQGPGWRYLELRGNGIGNLSVRHLGKLPARQGGFGCAFLPDGRLVTTTLGSRDLHTAGSGELLLWYPPFDRAKVPYCTLLEGLATPEGVAVTPDGKVLVSISRTDTGVTRPGVYTVSGNFPKAPTVFGGCGRETSVGTPLANAGRANMELFIAADAETYWPTDVTASGRGTWYVSNLPFGYINEYDKAGAFVRRVAKPGSGLPDGQLEAFTPYGMAVVPNGTLWVAHHGTQGTSAPNDAGQIAVIKFGPDRVPKEKERVQRELDQPDGLGVVKLTP